MTLDDVVATMILALIHSAAEKGVPETRVARASVAKSLTARRRKLWRMGWKLYWQYDRRKILDKRLA